MVAVPSPNLPTGISGIHSARDLGSVRRGGANQSFRNEAGPYTHLWEFLGYLPRRKAAVDGLVEVFLRELNPVFDAVYEPTFWAHYNKFWDRKYGEDDMDAVDLRWLSLLFIVLAFGELLVCPQPCSIEQQRESEESSLHFFWASRKAVVVSPTFSGESPDLVRAGILISRYLLHLKRIPESWLTQSFAVRMAQAQGMHIDGKGWGLPRKVLEIKRRLWASLYYLDRTTSLALGRPYTINDKHCTPMDISNIWVDDVDAEAAEAAQPLSMDQPTRVTYLVFQQHLSRISGRIHDECFNLTPGAARATYDKVIAFDEALQDWSRTLPSYFALKRTDYSLDELHPYLVWHRLYLHSAYHFIRVTLHRSYVLLPSITDRYKASREACIASACADLTARLTLHQPSMADRIRFNVAAHSLFNSALVLGVIAVRDPRSERTQAILEDLRAFCAKQNEDPWTNQFELAEIKVVELCIASVNRSRRPSPVRQEADVPNAQHDVSSSRVVDGIGHNHEAASVMQTYNFEGLPYDDHDIRYDDEWLNTFFGQNRAFPEPTDLQTWEELLGTLESKR
ncbi:putative transcriptional regulatory protein [Cyphellophora attinorum]|uniref:Putative transcriptional regulatory protein n=1 Tax=Cyphellophora attinorum TaxID=1664694 RepID=A0A0N1HEY5_9EURO|nr:putative transcriptional regulatory protein [Phialophora attinorum]KPI43710.1 putative transcriptional regulatory protein [Phialophora attinorum]